ncbi:MAG TPA: HAD family hydrolase, partial [Alphaproteobacteria bacterium]|nr:HAD family hydrolase [Alphaproteobacteria bacterium]
MVKAPVRLIAIDIDGTLLDPRFQLSARNLEALHAAHRAGIQIMLATGRRHDYALPVALEIGIPLMLASSNGALVRSSKGETFFADCLPAATARKVIRHMNDFRSHAVLTFDRRGGDALVAERLDELNRSIARWVQTNAMHI